MRGRIGRMEKRVDLDKDEPCPECGGRIVFVERHEDGTAIYPVVTAACVTNYLERDR